MADQPSRRRARPPDLSARAVRTSRPAGEKSRFRPGRFSNTARRLPGGGVLVATCTAGSSSSCRQDELLKALAEMKPVVWGE